MNGVFDLAPASCQKAGILQFDEPGAGYGFPLPYGGRDLAIGDDKRMQQRPLPFPLAFGYRAGLTFMPRV